MKKILAVLGASVLLFASIFVTSCAQAAEGDTFYATTTIGTPDVTAKAYPGVNILTWKEIKDAGSYTIYRTVGNGKIEEAKKPTGNVYIDTDIDENVNYKYRIVANPVNATSHDASQTEVSLKTAKIATDPNNIRGTWAPEGTPFLDLAKYESDYDSGAPVLSEATIDAKLITSVGDKVRVSFPVKPYAEYEVYIGQKNAGELVAKSALETSVTVKGYEYNETATVTLNVIYPGTKQVTVVATPLNKTLYGYSRVSSTATVDVKALGKITANAVSAEWTNYDYSTKVANTRVWFNPSSYDGVEFTTDEYTVYRAVYVAGETYSVTNNDGSTTDYRVYDSITKLGAVKKDTEVKVNDYPVYYYDDSLNISDVSGVRYYVVLNHKGELKSNTSKLLVPGTSDWKWDYTPDTSWTPVSTVAELYDVYITKDGTFHLKARIPNSETLTVTYDTFDTLNEARVAVNSELKKTLTTDDTGYYPVYAGAAVDTSKYYAFRVLATTSSTKDDDVAYVIAKAYKIGGAYYFEILSEEKPSNYSTTSTPSLTYDVEVTTTNYDSVTLDYSTSNAQYYNIYRKISSSSYSSYIDFTSDDLIDTVTTTTYPDTSSVLKNTSLDYYVYYKVEAVGYYDYSTSSTVRVSGLAAPEITLNASTNTITWSEVSSATEYYIYRAKTKAALEALSDSEYFNSVYASSYSSTCTYDVSENSFSDYYYAVKAYRYSDSTYSNFSNVVTVYRSDIDVDLYSFNGSTYTWRLKWDKDSAYTGSYYILHYTAADEKDDASVAKAKFEANPNSYSTSAYNSSYYDVTISSGATSKEFYAVATKTYEYDEDYLYRYVWNISDVIEIEPDSDNSLTVEGTSGNYTLSWNPIKYKDEKGVETAAAAYAVYEYTGYSYSWNNPMEYLLENAPKTVVTDGTSATSDASGYYNFFVVFGLSKVPQEGASAEDILATNVGCTSFVRVQN